MISLREIISEIITKINKEICTNGKEISSKCSFEIRINPPFTKPLKCKLKFNQPNNGPMLFSNIKLNVKAEANNKCPFIELNVLDMNNKSDKVDYLNDLSIYGIY